MCPLDPEKLIEAKKRARSELGKLNGMLRSERARRRRNGNRGPVDPEYAERLREGFEILEESEDGDEDL